MNMLERAAMALGLDVSRNGTPITWEPEERERLWRNSVSSGLADMQRAQARAALLAALDPEDEDALRAYYANQHRYVAQDGWDALPRPWKEELRAEFRRVVLALRQTAQGET